ncbi:MAG: serine/threonine-protein kinase [Gemmatimonadaceae bacterium]
MARTRHTTLDYAGSFRLLRKIASGGMATVYEAEQLGPAGFSKRVALKVIHPHYAAEREWVQLFIDEATLSADLMHTNIVQTHQLGEVNGSYYIAMEYIRGPTLRTLIERHRELGRPLPHSLAAHMVSRVCRALDFAHNFVAADGRCLDIVHRDVAPGNIMVTWDGHIKLADFGIHKALTSADPSADGKRLVGKKNYMSPEQGLALDVDDRSDIFSLGVVLWELLALEPLFDEEVTELAIDEIAVLPLPPMRERIPNIEPALEAILAGALDREPVRRPTAGAMGRALDAWCESQRPIANPDRLQEHLAALFPNTHRRPLAALDETDEATRFTNLRPGLRHQGKRLLARLLGR